MFRLHHVQLAMPEGQEDVARDFFVGVLGMREVEKPPQLVKRGGAWFRAGELEIHMGVDADFRAAAKAHPGILTTALDDVARRLEAAGFRVRHDDNLPGYRRFYVDDCFGNRLEFLQEIGPN